MDYLKNKSISFRNFSFKNSVSTINFNELNASFSKVYDNINQLHTVSISLDNAIYIDRLKTEYTNLAKILSDYLIYTKSNKELYSENYTYIKGKLREIIQMVNLDLSDIDNPYFYQTIDKKFMDYVSKFLQNNIISSITKASIRSITSIEIPATSSSTISNNPEKNVLGNAGAIQIKDNEELNRDFYFTHVNPLLTMAKGASLARKSHNPSGYSSTRTEDVKVSAAGVFPNNSNRDASTVSVRNSSANKKSLEDRALSTNDSYVKDGRYNSDIILNIAENFETQNGNISPAVFPKVSYIKEEDKCSYKSTDDDSKVIDSNSSIITSESGSDYEKEDSHSARFERASIDYKNKEELDNVSLSYFIASESSQVNSSTRRSSNSTDLSDDDKARNKSLNDHQLNEAEFNEATQYIDANNDLSNIHQEDNQEINRQSRQIAHNKKHNSFHFVPDMIVGFLSFTTFFTTRGRVVGATAASEFKNDEDKKINEQKVIVNTPLKKPTCFSFFESLFSKTKVINNKKINKKDGKFIPNSNRHINESNDPNFEDEAYFDFKKESDHLAQNIKKDLDLRAYVFTMAKHLNETFEGAQSANSRLLKLNPQDSYLAHVSTLVPLPGVSVALTLLGYIANYELNLSLKNSCHNLSNLSASSDSMNQIIIYVARTMALKKKAIIKSLAEEDAKKISLSESSNPYLKLIGKFQDFYNNKVKKYIFEEDGKFDTHVRKLAQQDITLILGKCFKGEFKSLSMLDGNEYNIAKAFINVLVNDMKNKEIEMLCNSKLSIVDELFEKTLVLLEPDEKEKSHINNDQSDDIKEHIIDNPNINQTGNFNIIAQDEYKIVVMGDNSELSI